MSLANPLLVINQLIAGLPGKSREHSLHRCETVNLEFGSLLCERSQTFRHVYFPLSGFISPGYRNQCSPAAGDGPDR